MILLIGRILFSILVVVVAAFFLQKIWTKDVDIVGLLKKPTEIVPTKDKSFSVNSTWFINQIPPVISFVQNEEVFPICTAMVVNFTNMKTTPIMFLSYSVEQERPDGTWEDILLPHGSDGKFYQGVDLRNVNEVSFVTFDSVVQNKNIGTGETVSGHIFMTKHAKGKLRFTFGTVGGETESALLEPIATGKGWPVQPPMLTSLHRSADISKLPVVVPQSQ